MKYTKFQDIPSFTPSGNYQVNISWEYLEKTLEEWEKDYKLHLNPDFQRAHVWTEEKQIAYVEYVLRNGHSSRVIYWNSPSWGRGTRERPFPTDIYLVDGKQRLEAARRFLHNEIPAFGTLYKDYEDRMSIVVANFVFSVNDLETRAEMLQWYLDLNSGGVVHTKAEIEKVKKLLEDEKRLSEAKK